MNWTLYKREMKGSVKLLLIFGAVITLYVTIIITMYEPEMMATLDSFYEVIFILLHFADFCNSLFKFENLFFKLQAFSFILL